MRLDSEFVQLPLAFDVERLKTEALQFSEYDWSYHPQRYDGNTALNLVSKDGGKGDDYVGNMQATDALERCPYIQQIMARLGTVIGRSRFMRLAPGKGVPAHSDTDYSWRDRVRIHIPIITHPSIVFSSTESISQTKVEVHKRAGEAWIFDNWREHAVSNEADIHRIHLVIDTVGSAEFWKLVAKGRDPKLQSENDFTAEFIPYIQDQEERSIPFERFNQLPVRSPEELLAISNDLLSELDYESAGQAQQKSRQVLTELVQDWRFLWAQYLDSDEGMDAYLTRINNTKNQLKPILQDCYLKSNGANAFEVIDNWLDRTTEAGRGSSRLQAALRAGKQTLYKGKIPEFREPVFIVAAPRSGSTMLFEAMKNNRDLWSIGDESHLEIESIPELQPRNRGFQSNGLDASDYTEQIGRQLTENFMHRLQNFRCAAYADLPPEFQADSIRFVEKTPKNALRIPFFKAMYPDAKFVYLYRSAQANIGSIIDAWQSSKFVTYRNIDDVEGQNWSLLLNDGWRNYIGKHVAEIACFQWGATNNAVMDALADLPQSDWVALNYENLIANPGPNIERLCQFLSLPFGPKMQSYATNGFPNSKYVLTQPNQEKWRRHEDDIGRYIEMCAPVIKRISNLPH